MVKRRCGADCGDFLFTVATPGCSGALSQERMDRTDAGIKMELSDAPYWWFWAVGLLRVFFVYRPALVVGAGFGLADAFPPDPAAVLFAFITADQLGL